MTGSKDSMRAVARGAARCDSSATRTSSAARDVTTRRSIATAKGHLPDMLGEAENRVEILERRSGAIFRARLFGLTEDEAREACLSLKRRHLPCVPVPGSMDLGATVATGKTG